MPRPSLRSSRDFHRVRSVGTRARSDGLTVWVAPGMAGSPTRVGLAPRSRKATERNRIKRRLRAAWREAAPRPGLDAVVGADQTSLQESFQDLVNHLKLALTRAESRL